ncbi:hypothetical protein [Streptomyces malaysiensis]|uniref:Uncharacterized protein n=1 Tax=Streptomyces malaysiensis subsp. samsunensis TaxID=459658 RepID=A0A9X2RZK8_STRMQ|nr:hypothetical protein [Streptomyces samsunensis]MCQ8836308.1 hypothetical protein [Streptomyces samsunensis]
MKGGTTHTSAPHLTERSGPFEPPAGNVGSGGRLPPAGDSDSASPPAVDRDRERFPDAPDRRDTTVRGVHRPPVTW